MTFFDVITIAWTLVVALLLFGVTVFVHELGHFLAARRMGLVVEKFAIGFGPTLYSFKRDGVEYAIKALPLGGFVQLPQMAPMDMVEGETANKKEDLPPVTPWAKIVTAFWGPAASFLLALFLAVVVWIVGKPDYVTLHSTQIGFLQKDAPAEKAGFKLGDTILAINDRKVDRWAGGVDGVKENIVLSDTDKIKFELRGLDGQIRDVWVKPELNKDQENLRTIGVLQSSPLIIDQINLKSPASTAGLQKGDEILKADGETLWSPYQLMNLVQAAKGPMQLEVKRGDQILPISITPLLVKNKEIKEKGKEIKDIGVSWAEGLPITIYPSPLTQISSSATLIYRTLSALFSPKSDVGVGHLSGAIGIFNTIMLLLRYEPAQLLAFCVMFNVNLALLNMLPIPILDGGHILFSLIEAIRRRPVSLKIMSAVQTATFVLMIGLFLFISYRDVLRVGKRYSAPKPEKLEDVQFENSPETIKN